MQLILAIEEQFNFRFTTDEVSAIKTGGRFHRRASGGDAGEISMTGDASAKDLAEYVLGRANRLPCCAEALALIDRCGQGFRSNWARAIASYLAAPTADPALQGRGLGRHWRAATARWRGSFPPGCWPIAAMPPRHARAFVARYRRLPRPSPQVLLHRDRLLLQRGCVAEAAADLQLALSLFPPTRSSSRAKNFCNAVLAAGQWQPRRKAKLAILSSSTTALLTPVLRTAGFRNGLELEIDEGVYGNYQQEILDPGLGPVRLSAGPGRHPAESSRSWPACRPAERIVPWSSASTCGNLWSILQRRNPCHLIQVGFDLPCEAAWGSLEDSLPEGRRPGHRRRRIWQFPGDLPGGVSFLDVQHVVAQAGREFWSALQWHTAKQYPGGRRAARRWPMPLSATPRRRWGSAERSWPWTWTIPCGTA